MLLIFKFLKTIFVLEFWADPISRTCCRPRSLLPRAPREAPRGPEAASGGSRTSLRHPFEVAKNVTKIGVPGKCAPRPRREAYFFKNHALTTGASTTFQIEVMKKSQKNDEKVAAAAARAIISLCPKNERTQIVTWKPSKFLCKNRQRWKNRQNRTFGFWHL